MGINMTQNYCPMEHVAFCHMWQGQTAANMRTLLRLHCNITPCSNEPDFYICIWKKNQQLSNLKNVLFKGWLRSSLNQRMQNV